MILAVLIAAEQLVSLPSLSRPMDYLPFEANLGGQWLVELQDKVYARPGATDL